MCVCVSVQAYHPYHSPFHISLPSTITVIIIIIHFSTLQSSTLFPPLCETLTSRAQNTKTAKRHRNVTLDLKTTLRGIKVASSSLHRRASPRLGPRRASHPFAAHKELEGRRGELAGFEMVLYHANTTREGGVKAAGLTVMAI